MKRSICSRPWWWTPGSAAVLVLSTLAAAAASARPARTDAAPGSTAPPPALRVADGQVLLTLDEAIEIALRRNLTLQIERFTREQFRLGIEQASGIFDLRAEAFGQHAEGSTPSASQLEGAAVRQDEQQILNLGLSQLTPIGGELEFSFDNTRFETNSTFFALNPSFTVDASLSYTLPLLRNFGTLPTKRGILVARIQDEGNRAFFEQQVESIVQQVENAYWDLLEARKQLEVAQQSLELAEELHRRNKIQVEVGTRPPLDLVQSEATVATRQEEIIRARTAVGDGGDQLLLLLNVDQGPVWDAEILPETAAETEPIEIDLAGAIATALGERPELAQQRLEVERLDVESRFFHNQKRPRLDLLLSYALSGVGGDQLQFDPETGAPVIDPDTGEQEVVSGGYSDALDQVSGADFDGWSVGVVLAYPLQNRAAKAQAAAAALDLDKGQTELQRLQQQVITEVRTAARLVEAAAETIQSAGVSRRLQERNLEAEQKRYENGMSTSFQVTEIQEDLALAQSREVTAVVGYRKALVDYYRVLGRLLEETGVELTAE